MERENATNAWFTTKQCMFKATFYPKYKIVLHGLCPCVCDKFHVCILGENLKRSSSFLDQTKTASLSQCNIQQPRQTGLWGKVIFLHFFKNKVPVKGYIRKGQHWLWPERYTMTPYQCYGEVCSIAASLPPRHHHYHHPPPAGVVPGLDQTINAVPSLMGMCTYIKTLFIEKK